MHTLMRDSTVEALANVPINGTVMPPPMNTNFHAGSSTSSHLTQPKLENENAPSGSHSQIYNMNNQFSNVTKNELSASNSIPVIHGSMRDLTPQAPSNLPLNSSPIPPPPTEMSCYPGSRTPAQYSQLKVENKEASSSHSRISNANNQSINVHTHKLQKEMPQEHAIVHEVIQGLHRR